MSYNLMNSKAGIIAYTGLMVAVIEVSKLALSSLPNIELTSFWLIMFTLFFGKRVLPVIPAFILIEGFVYGIHIWWIMYLYIWPLLVLLTWIFRKVDSALFYAIFSGIFGLCFGFLCSIPYFFIGMSSGGIVAGLNSAMAFWISGIPWDLVHCVGNFTGMLILYNPIKKIILKAKINTNI